MGKHILKYPHRNINTARTLRKNMTDAERKLWSRLRSNQLGIKFRRQVPYGSHIVDFMSLEARLIVEVDGSRHYSMDATLKDQQRDHYLTAEGFTVLRFNNAEVFENIDNVVEMIWEKLPKGKD